MRKKLFKLYEFSNSLLGTVIIVLLVMFFFAQAFVIPSGSMKNTLLIGDHLFVKKFSYGIPIPHLPWIEVPLLPDFNHNGHLISGSKPKRGDIVVFRFPLKPKEHYVKRNFAVGGDEIIYTPKTFYLRPFEGDNYIDKHYSKNDIVILDGKKFVKNPYKHYKGIHYTDGKDIFKLMLELYFDGKLQGMKPITIDNLPQGEYKFNAFYTKVPNNEYFMIGDNRDNSYDSRFWGFVPYKDIVGKPWFVYFSWDKDYKIRWQRVGRTVNTLQNDPQYIHEQP